MEPSNVLVPLDGSPLSDDALTHALETFDCPVTVLNVVTPLDASMSEGGILEPDEERRDEARTRADEIVARATRRAEDAGRSVEVAVETGNPADTILDYVDANDADHVVMGGHGGEPDGLAGRLLGTVATAVVRRAPVTVTVVR